MKDDVTYRILDASLNRANEGLRTIEDYARFVLNNPDFSVRAKNLRHRLTTAVKPLDTRRLLANRDAINDCGTSITTDSEQLRTSLNTVVAAAFCRVQQALRSIEEYGKLVSGSVASAVEQLRYKSYTLERDLLLSISRAQRLQHARLYLIVDLSGGTDEWLNRLRGLATAGADVIQIRDKSADDRTLWQRCKLAAGMFRQLGPIDDQKSSQRCQLIINDRADIAADVDADGVHVGQEELPVDAVRRIIGHDKLIGLSTHSIEQLREAAELDVDYIGCGPTFPSLTKAFDQYVGVALAAAATRDFSVPAFAIGGINEKNVSELLQANVKRVAVSGAVWGQPDEILRCERLAERLNGEI